MPGTAESLRRAGPLSLSSEAGFWRETASAGIGKENEICADGFVNAGFPGMIPGHIPGMIRVINRNCHGANVLGIWWPQGTEKNGERDPMHSFCHTEVDDLVHRVTITHRSQTKPYLPAAHPAIVQIPWLLGELWPFKWSAVYNAVRLRIAMPKRTMTNERVLLDKRCSHAARLPTRFDILNSRGLTSLYQTDVWNCP